MKVLRSTLIDLFKAAGWKIADKWVAWSVAKLTEKIEQLVDIAKEGNLDEPENEKHAELLQDLVDAVDNETEITILDKDEGKKKKKKVEDAKKGKTKKASKDDDDEDDEDDDDDEPQHKKKGKKMKTAEKKKKKKNRDEEDEPKSKKKKNRDEPEKKKKKKKSAPRESNVEHDKFGCVIGSKNAKVMKAVTKKAHTMKEIVESAGQEGGFYDLLNKKTKEGFLEKTGDNKYKLKK